MSSVSREIEKLRKLIVDNEEAKAVRECSAFLSKASRYGDEWWQFASATVDLASEHGSNELNFFILTELDKALVETNRPIKPELEFELHKALAGSSFERGDMESFKNHAASAMKVFSANRQFHNRYDFVSRVAFCALHAELLDDAETALRRYLRYTRNEPPNRKHRELMMIQLLAEVLEKQGKPDEAHKIKSECFEEKVAAYKALEPYDRLKIPILDDWGRDDLTSFFDTVYSNAVISYGSSPSIQDLLMDLNARFVVARESGQIETINLIKDKHSDSSLESLKLSEEDRLATFFFLRTHASLLGAMSTALSGLIPESYSLMRAAIENALYAFFVFTNQDAKTVWLARRLDDDDSRKAVRRMFVNREMFEALRKHTAVVGDRTSLLYELTIEDGAHPNAAQFHKHAVQNNEKGSLGIGINILDPEHIPVCIEHLHTVGMICLEVFKLIYPKWVW